jgi:hypothetical protein
MAVAINRDTSLAINRINRDASLIYLKEAEVSQWGGEMGGVSLVIPSSIRTFQLAEDETFIRTQGFSQVALAQ